MTDAIMPGNESSSWSPGPGGMLVRRDSSSLFEYSDTTPPSVGNLDDRNRLQRYPGSQQHQYYHHYGSSGFNSGNGGKHGSSGSPASFGSAFRLRNDTTSPSMRVVRFSGRDDDSDDIVPELMDEENLRPQGGNYSNLPQGQQRSTPSFFSPASWMTQLAYSFRSPQVTNSHRKRSISTEVREYPHHVPTPSDRTQKLDIEATGSRERGERAPLLAGSSKEKRSEESRTSEAPVQMGNHRLHIFPLKAVTVAAAFMRDYEANRPPSLTQNPTDWQLILHEIKYSVFFTSVLWVAALALFVSSGFEHVSAVSPDRQSMRNRIILSSLNLFAFVIFAFDLWIRNHLRGNEDDPPQISREDPRAQKPSGKTAKRIPPPSKAPVDPRLRSSRSGKLVKPLVLFGIVLVCENISRLLVTTDGVVLFSSLFKPLALFYVSYQARNALEALSRILKIVTRVIAMELLLILMFAAVGCRLFADYEQFQNLSTAWLSLFELSTTVVNPSIWMPMYQDSAYSAVFFVCFIVVSVFYLHSLVLSVVFQTYIHAASEIHERSAMDRDDAVHMTYLALQKGSRQGSVDVELIRQMLVVLRPHYGPIKINALVEIVDPSQQRYIDYPTFRTKIRQALNASIRTPRNASTMAMSVELLAVFVAVVNFLYVIMVSSAFDEEWFNASQEIVGSIITIIASLELLVRFNPLRVADFAPLTRLNTTFDGIALLAALVSFVGMVLYLAGDVDSSLELILMGRAIDMIRVMRFFRIFRDVVRRSADVMPALAGPAILVLTSLHIFVYAGMALWGGSIAVGENEGYITPLYDLNNFNSYREGALTMFQVLVVNDWHAIAQVFLFASRCSSAYIVYPFFVVSNLIGVSIMLNVLTAFFVEAFVTKLDDSVAQKSESKPQTDADYAIHTSERASVRRVISSNNFGNLHQSGDMKHGNDAGSDHEADADSEGSSESELYEFDVYEREGFDKIMQTVAGASQGKEDYGRRVCSYLEAFEDLAPGREPVGFLICDQLTLERFGNRRFQSIAVGFLEVNELHVVVSDMHAELLALSSRASSDLVHDRTLTRTFVNREDPAKRLELSASLIRRHPALSLFVAQIRGSS